MAYWDDYDKVPYAFPHVYDYMEGADAVSREYLSNEGVSLLENAAHLGLPVPEKMKEILEQLHDRAETENSNQEDE